MFALLYLIHLSSSGIALKPVLQTKKTTMEKIRKYTLAEKKTTVYCSKKIKMKVHSSCDENYSTSASTEMEARNSALQINCQMVLSCLLLESLHLGSKR